MNPYCHVRYGRCTQCGLPRDARILNVCPWHTNFMAYYKHNEPFLRALQAKFEQKVQAAADEAPIPPHEAAVPELPYTPEDLRWLKAIGVRA